MMPGYLLRAQYGRVNEQIEMFTLMPLQYASAPVSTALNNAVGGGADDFDTTNPTSTRDGAAIIDLWLNELEKVQPQHGPLLQSTVDEVGQLPAVNDNGSIYTVSHNGYGFAAGFAKGYARRRAENLQRYAVVAKIEARKTKNEPVMVQKEDEADFWGSVKSWVEAVGVTRMKPDPLPEWLAGLGIEWNP
jgi:hypothetical protein